MLFDNVGWVVAQAPEHVIENLKLDEKSKQSGKKVVKRSAPEGFVAWDKKTFERLQTAAPERLTSRFQVTHAMLLNVLGRPDGDAGGFVEVPAGGEPRPIGIGAVVEPGEVILSGEGGSQGQSDQSDSHRTTIQRMRIGVGPGRHWRPEVSTT